MEREVIESNEASEARLKILMESESSQAVRNMVMNTLKIRGKAKC